MEIYLLNGLIAAVFTILTLVVLNFLCKNWLNRMSYNSFFVLVLISVFGFFSLYFFLGFQLTIRLWLLF